MHLISEIASVCPNRQIVDIGENCYIYLAVTMAVAAPLNPITITNVALLVFGEKENRRGRKKTHTEQKGKENANPTKTHNYRFSRFGYSQSILHRFNQMATTNRITCILFSRNYWQMLIFDEITKIKWISLYFHFQPKEKKNRFELRVRNDHNTST